MTKRAVERAQRRPRRCPGCESSFVARQWTGSSWQKFCSRQCYLTFAARRQWTEILCAHCGKLTRKRRAEIRRNKVSLCSTECRRAFHVGANHPQYRGTPAPFGGEWQRIARAQRKRDGYKCRLCGAVWPGRPAIAYAVDHIYPRRAFVDPRIADHALNLATLCHVCHTRKTMTAEAKWVRGDVLDFERYKASVLPEELVAELRALVGPHLTQTHPQLTSLTS